MNELLKSLLALVFVVALSLRFESVQAQPGPDITDSVRNSFERKITSVHQEKVFVHLDRSAYITGETIWLSAYCVDAAFHTPAGLSRVLNIELLDVSGQAVEQIRIKLTDGYGHGQIFVSPEIQSGHYILRAYTNWMKNFGPEFVFKKNIKVVNPASARDTRVVSPDSQPLVEFFPEGGHLVAGLRSKVAVKATDRFGNGLAVAGIVYDQDDNEVADFTTSNLGYTYFFITPDQKNTYSARVELDSAIIKYPLPIVMENGFILSVNTADQENLEISIQHTGSTQGNPYLVVHSRGIIKKLFPVNINQPNNLYIETGSLSEGISHITLLGSDFSPLCERLVFKYPDGSEVVDLNSGKVTYNKREKIALSLKLNEAFIDEDLANLSVSVSRSDGFDRYADNIVSNLLLTSDLTGSIPDPWIFFDPENGSRARQLDLVMLTNGWRRFHWDDLKNGQNITRKYPAEINAPILSGQVQTNKQIPPKSLQVNFPGKASVMNSVGLDDDGLFHVEVPFRVDNEDVLFFINDDTLQSDQVSIFSPFDLENPETWNFEEFSIESRGYLEALNTNIQVSQVYRDYNHVNGLQTEALQTKTAFYGIPDHLYLLDDYTRFETIEDLFIEYIRSAVIRSNRRSSGFHIIYDGAVMSGKALALIDGVPMLNFDDVMSFDPLKIEKIGVINNVYRMGNIEYFGILDFTTYLGDFNGQDLPGYIVEKVYHSLQAPRLFYAPDYSVNQGQLARIPDYRNTLYWNPKVTINGTDWSGLEFYSSDDTGLYQIEINGITNGGQPIYLRDSFEVK